MYASDIGRVDDHLTLVFLVARSQHIRVSMDGGIRGAVWQLAKPTSASVSPSLRAEDRKKSPCHEPLCCVLLLPARFEPAVLEFS